MTDTIVIADAPDTRLAARLDDEIAAFSRHGFAVVGELPDYPVGHSSLLLHKRLVG